MKKSYGIVYLFNCIARYLSVLLLVLCVCIPNHSDAQEFSEYRLAADDEISVKVFDEPDLSLDSTRIAADGSISMPLIGKVQVKGLTTDQVETLISQMYLGDYLKQPNISVTIVEYRQFYVDGEIDKPGGYSFREGMTVQRAITLAGGFTERAARSKIFLLREGSKQKINVNLDTLVLPGDVITIEESFF